MGRGAEDIFHCLACGHTVVYEPDHEKEVKCYECKAVHRVTHYTPLIELLKTGLPCCDKPNVQTFDNDVVIDSHVCMNCGMIHQQGANDHGNGHQRNEK